MSTEKLQIEKLSPTERKELLKQLNQEEARAAAALKDDREEYKKTVNDLVTEHIKKLQNISSMLSKAKAEVFNEFASIIELKKDLFGFKEGQQSHSFTNELGETIEIGCRVIEAWDDTVEAGIAKVNHYIQSLATDKETGQLVKVVQSLLKKDAKGNLKASRILELKNLAEELDNVEFTDAVEIMRAAYRPVKSAYFIEARVKDGIHKNQGVPLSITSAPFPLGIKIDTKAF